MKESFGQVCQLVQQIQWKDPTPMNDSLAKRHRSCILFWSLFSACIGYWRVFAYGSGMCVYSFQGILTQDVYLKWKQRVRSFNAEGRGTDTAMSASLARCASTNQRAIITYKAKPWAGLTFRSKMQQLTYSYNFSNEDKD